LRRCEDVQTLWDLRSQPILLTADQHGPRCLKGGVGLSMARVPKTPC
jgi:hypothetical protein